MLLSFLGDCRSPNLGSYTIRMFQVMNYVLFNEKIRDFENIIMRVAHHPYSLTFIPKYSNMGPLRHNHAK